MGRYIFKLDEEHDEYIEWSTVTDSPASWPFSFDLAIECGYDPVRMNRALERGTSALWLNPPDGAWNDATIMIADSEGQGYIKREDLRAYVYAVLADEERDVKTNHSHKFVTRFDDD